MENQRVQVSAAAKLLGVTQAQLRKMLRQKSVPFGHAVKTSDDPLRFTYLIFRRPLLEYMGMERWPEEGGKA